VHAWDMFRDMCSESRDLFTFWEIADNISQTVQDRHVVGMGD